MELTPPKNEKIFVQYVSDDKVTHVITANQLRDIYYLCEVNNNKCVKTKYKSNNPLELEQYIYGNKSKQNKNFKKVLDK